MSRTLVCLLLAFAFIRPPAHAATDDGFSVARTYVASNARTDGIVRIMEDGFPYITAEVVAQPVDGKDVRTMADIARVAVSKHAGIVAHPAPNSAEHITWHWSLGAVSLIARNMWQPHVTPGDSALAPGESVVSRAPSIDELPADLREAIAQYMRANDGVGVPKIVLLAYTENGKDRAPYMLAPNLPASAFANKQTWIRAVQRIGWFIPGNELVTPPPADPRAFASLFDGIAPL